MIKTYDYYENNVLVANGTTREIAEQINYSQSTIIKQLKKPTKGRKLVQIGHKKQAKKKLNNKIYALYKGDTYIDMGTLEEIAERQGMKLENIYCLKSPRQFAKIERGANVKILIEVED